MKKTKKAKKLNSTIAMLKEYRESNRLTYEELGAQMNMDRSKLQLWLTGKVIPRDTSLKEVQDFLNAIHARQFVEIAEADKTYIDSRLVAEWTGKTHKNLLQDIRNYIKDLEKSEAELSAGLKSQPCGKAQNTNVFKQRYYFIESTYKHPLTKKELPCYLITQKGCEMIANKMTGIKGTKFTALYIDEYHRMKDNEQAKHIDHDQKATKSIEQEDLFKATSELQEAPQWSDEFLSFDYQESLTDEEKRDLEFLRHKLDRLKDCNSLDTLKGGLLQVVNLIKLLDK